MKAIIHILAVFLLCIAFSCKSIEYVPTESKTTVRDSVNVRDSIVTKEVINKKDSVVVRDSVVTVVDDNGNVLRMELYRLKEIYKDSQKEYYDLQAKYNALLSQKADSVQVPYPIERKLTRWESLKMKIGGYSIGIIIIIVLIVVGWLIYKLKK